MKQQIFKKFIPGTVFNPLKGKYLVSKEYQLVKLKFPSRLNAMAIDPSKITSNENMIFTPGEVVFSVKIYRNIVIRIEGKRNQISISNDSKRKSLIIHAVKLMQKALNVDDGLYISVDNKNELRHSGLGSSGALIAGVASAVNELYGKPISNGKLVVYLAQNHGEEIETDNDHIQQVQCIGGSAASGNFNDGLIIITGKSKIIATMKVPKEYKAVIGIPKDYKPLDAEKMMKLEENNLDKFLVTGKRYGREIAYRMLHEAIPAMVDQNLIPIGNLIFDYRFKMGSIKNCSFSYSKMISIANKIAFLKNETDTPVLSLSSVGPAFFAITKDTNKISDIFKKNGMKSIIVEIENSKYKVSRKTFWNDQKIVEYFADKPPDFRIKTRLEKIKKRSKIKALDLGCGGGRHTKLLLQLGFDVYACDTNPEMLKATRNKTAGMWSEVNDQKRIVEGNILSTPYPDRIFGAVVATGVLHQAKSIREYKDAIRELSRITKPEAIICLNIFTNKVWDNTYLPVAGEKYTVMTKEGLYMTLLPKNIFYDLMSESGFGLESELAEDVKDENTGPRAVLRANFIKI